MRDKDMITEGFISDVKDQLLVHRSIKDLHHTVLQSQPEYATGKIVDKKLKGGLSEISNSILSKIIIDEEYITIKGLNFVKFFQRIKTYYSENNFKKIFMVVYTEKSEKLWKRGKIDKKDMTIKELKLPIFFALEVAMMFEDLGSFYNVNHYLKIARQIRTKTWIIQLHKPVEKISIDTNKLRNIRYKLKPYQLEFIEMYPTLKHRFSMDGYILSFDQGLGKTLTSISLAECLGSEQVVIVCPNSLKENWAYEIKEYFYRYDNEKIWKDHVYVHGSNKYKFTKNTRYIIVNMEAIPAVYNLINNKKSSILIVDEMHNIRNIKGKRTQELITLKERLGKTDVLLMSGTPIKAIPNEICPALMLIDPLFTEEVAELYNKCFNVNGLGTKTIVNTRFGLVMHRKTKDEVLQLPKKMIHELKLKVSNSEKYLSRTVKNEVNEEFQRLYAIELKNNDTLQKAYLDKVNKFSKAPKKEHEAYIKYINNMDKESDVEYSEFEMEKFDNFTKTYVLPNIYYPTDLKDFKEAETAYMQMKARAMGRAIGKILHPRRKEMFIELYEQNKEEIKDMLNNSTKKTVIFSTILEVVDYISNDLSNDGIGNVKIVGGVSNRMDLIQSFKNDDEIDVLIATSQTLSTGVTLTEANQMLFFGTPWRSADYNQCCDRIYRIGQNTDVNIYNVLLDTDDKLNLSTRMNDILNWSDDMFTNMVEGDNK